MSPPRVGSVALLPAILAITVMLAQTDGGLGTTYRLYYPGQGLPRLQTTARAPPGHGNTVTQPGPLRDTGGNFGSPSPLAG